MKNLLPLLVALFCASYSQVQARLGESLVELQTRYGKPTGPEIRDGLSCVSFASGGKTITCLLANDKCVAECIKVTSGGRMSHDEVKAAAAQICGNSPEAWEHQDNRLPSQKSKSRSPRPPQSGPAAFVANGYACDTTPDGHLVASTSWIARARPLVKPVTPSGKTPY